MTFTPPASKVCLLLLMIIGSSLSIAANPSDYPTIDDELGQLLVRNMGQLMNESSPDNPDYPTFTDEHYKARFLEMSGAIQYRLTTDIKNHIIHRTERYRSATERTLGLSEVYFPIFEEYLAEKDIPHHIKYLPIVESNLNGVARSHAAAVGLWQFIPGTAKLYGLTVTSYLDERSDTHKASHAAATMLSNLFKRYGDWPLALAAYNCGPGRVDRYVKGNDKDFWDIRASLPRETQMYVPYFMAVAYSYEFHHLHELTAKKQHADIVLTDSIHLAPGYQTLAQLSKYYNIDKDTLKRLNPGYIKNYVPASGSNHILVLPARIVAKHRNYEAAYQRIMDMRTENPIKCIRRVNNEYELRKLMKAHRFSREDVLFWNGLPSNYSIKKGDVLAIRRYHVPKDAWAKQFVPPTIESISIASLEVIGLDDKRKKAVTAPVYTTIKNKKAVKNVHTPALAATNKNMPSTKNDNPYKLSNKTTAVTAQRANQPDVIDNVSENRTRQRRLRTPATTTTQPATIASVPEPTATSANQATVKKEQQQTLALQETAKQSTNLYKKEQAATKAIVSNTTTKEEKQALAYLDAQRQKLVEVEGQKEQATAAELAAAKKAEAARQVEEARQAELAAAKKAEAARQVEEARQAELAAAKKAEAARQVEEARQAELAAAKKAEAARQVEEARQAELAAAKKAEAARQVEEARQAELAAAKKAEAARQVEEARQAELAAAKKAEAARQVEEARQAELAAAKKAEAARQVEETRQAELAAAKKAEAARQVQIAALEKAEALKKAEEANQAALAAAQKEEALKKAEATLQAQIAATKKAEAAKQAQLAAAKKAESTQQVQIQKAVPLNTNNFEMHTVEKNETIWEIQRRYPRTTARDILMLNNLTSRDILREGMQLKIPVQ